MDPRLNTLNLTERARLAFQEHVGRQVELRVVPENQAEQGNLTFVFRAKAAKIDRTYQAEPVETMDKATVARLIRDWRPDENRLIIAPYVDEDKVKKLKDAGIPFMDAVGNAHLTWPGFFLLITGIAAPTDLLPRKLPKTGRMLNPAGLQVLFVFLTRPEYLNRPYRDIENAAGVALGTVGWVVNELKYEGYIVDIKGNNRLAKRRQLMDEWVTAYIRRLHTRRTIRRFKAEDPAWWKTTNLRDYDAQWGGDVAAEKLTGYLKPMELVVYARETPTKLFQAQRMRATPDGDVAIIDMFWNFPPNEVEKDMVPPLLVYADLMATGDPRAVETAKMIHERYLAGPDDQG